MKHVWIININSLNIKNYNTSPILLQRIEVVIKKLRRNVETSLK